MVDIGIHVKPSSQGKSLCSSSWHMPCIHQSWPSSRLVHYERCVTDTAFFSSATLALIQKLRISSPGHPSLASLVQAYLAGPLGGNGKLASKDRVNKSSRLILPWHPCFSGLGRRLCICLEDFTREGFPEFAPTIVFSNGGRNVARRVQAAGLNKMTKFIRGSGR